jgi:uncharacterized protein with HEPN domain
MYERDLILFLNDILKSTQKIQKYVEGKAFDDFKKDELLIDGIVRNLEVIGEAVKNIPASFRKKYPSVEWKKIAGLRDILIHEYFGIDYELLWDIIVNKIPSLGQEVEYILKDLKGK